MFEEIMSDRISSSNLLSLFLTALYKEDDSEGAFYAGIIAEAPNGRNEHRFVCIIIILCSTGFQPAELMPWHAFYCLSDLLFDHLSMSLSCS